MKRCQHPNGEEYGCFGLATDETCLQTSIGSRFACMTTRDEQLPGGMVVTLAHTELGVRKGETAATVTDALKDRVGGDALR